MQNVVEMALKLLFLPKNRKNQPADGGALSPGPLYDALELHRFGWHGA